MTILNLDLNGGKHLIATDGAVDVIFRGHAIPCEVQMKTDHVELRVHGIELCLHFTIDVNESSIYIYALNITDNQCPLSADIKSKGAFLLEFVDEIARQLGIRTISLLDASYRLCNGGKHDGELVDFSFLSTMIHGESWYEKNGFRYVSDDKERREKTRHASITKIGAYFRRFSQTDQSNAAQKQKAENLASFYRRNPQFLDAEYAASLLDSTQRTTTLRERLFKKIIADQDEPDPVLNQIRILHDSIRMFRKTHSSVRLCDFLTYVWYADCSSYVEIVRLLFPPAHQKHLPERILPDYPRQRVMRRLVSS